MEDNTKESGSIITWKASVSTHGKMAEDTKENTKMTRNMDMEFTLGLIVDSIKDGGSKGNSMASVDTKFQAVILNLVFGKTASVLSGLMINKLKKFFPISLTIDNSSARRKAISTFFSNQFLLNQITLTEA
jgi:hypothetical protein